MSGLIEQNVTFHDGEYYTSFDFEQWLKDTPTDIRMILTDYDGEEQRAECTLELDEWEYLAHRILDMVEHQRKITNG